METPHGQTEWLTEMTKTITFPQTTYVGDNNGHTSDIEFFQ